MSLHIECSRTLRDAYNRILVPVEIGGGLLWSETMAVAGTSVAAVPTGEPTAVLTLTAEVDMWISIGASPNAATVGLRRRLKAGVPRSFQAEAAQKVAWAAT